MIFLQLLLLVQSILLPLDPLKGHVFDEVTGQPLGYVNIGIKGTTIGTVSDETGYFALSLRNQPADAQVRFSIIGYKPKVMAVKEFSEGHNRITLTPERLELDDIYISKSRLRKKEKGNKTTSKRIVTGWNKYILGGERGIRIKAASKPTYVQSLHFHIANNGFEEVLVRVHFRSFREDRPFDHVFNKDILVPVKVKSGWIDVDLEEYKLVFEEDVAVTLQPVTRKGECEDEGNCFLISLDILKPFTTDWLIYKMSSEADWEIKKSYSPGIYLTVYE
ncbi:MAG TPA: hypothetical protein DD671_14445 [Balneolaceae bacterium]|nr:hypothetical protein [Balneola sp.]HBQ60773.1 hypothetical protein [Balneolaceae bacterium]|tara:strand:+ start:4341 stop:5171 length:831 start_codon:yes stop_codon:yes gene_type:complete